MNESDIEQPEFDFSLEEEAPPPRFGGCLILLVFVTPVIFACSLAFLVGIFMLAVQSGFLVVNVR